MAGDLINQIPVELLSEIILICAHIPNQSELIPTDYRAKIDGLGYPLHPYRPILDRGAAPYTLSSVCKKWRSIGLSTPMLWSKFTIPERIGSLPKFAFQLRKWLRLSKDCPLQFNYLNERGDYGSELMAVLFQHIHRWNIVYLDLGFEYIRTARTLILQVQQQLSRYLLKAENLHTLEIRHCDQQSQLSDIPFLLRLPSLRRLAVASDYLTVETPGCFNLTHLELTPLKEGPNTSLFEYLRQFPSLTDFKVSIGNRGYRLDPTSLTPCTHTALTEFTIGAHGFHRLLKTILGNIHLLKIRRLRVTGINFQYDVRELFNAIEDFIWRHESTLSDFEIAGSNLSSDELIRILALFPKHLVSCRFVLNELTDENVKKLTLNPSDPSQDLAPNLSYIFFRVPKLYRDRIPYRHEYDRPRSPSGDLLTDMILSRWSRNPHVTFNLEMFHTGENPLSDSRVAMQMRRGSRLSISDRKARA